MKFTQLLFALAFSPLALAQPKNPVCDPSFVYCTSCACAQGVKPDMDAACREKNRSYSLGGSITTVDGVSTCTTQCCDDS
ncbi:hypothetical protein BUE80_DR005632 [Diplocarpon rosae]|nr:hypothetical protein BUE80_DR005632 [Diplocarpon rosae]